MVVGTIAIHLTQELRVFARLAFERIVRSSLVSWHFQAFIEI